MFNQLEPRWICIIFFKQRPRRYCLSMEKTHFLNIGTEVCKCFSDTSGEKWGSTVRKREDVGRDRVGRLLVPLQINSQMVR